MPVAKSHPHGTEVNDMILNPITQLDTEAQSHNPNERLWRQDENKRKAASLWGRPEIRHRRQ